MTSKYWLIASKTQALSSIWTDFFGLVGAGRSTELCCSDLQIESPPKVILGVSNMFWIAERFSSKDLRSTSLTPNNHWYQSCFLERLNAELVIAAVSVLTFFSPCSTQVLNWKLKVLTSRASRPRQSVSRWGPRDVEHFFDAGTGSDLFELGIDLQTWLCGTGRLDNLKKICEVSLELVAIKSGFNMLMYHTKVNWLRLIMIPRQMIATLWSLRRRRFVTRHLRGRMTMLHGYQQLNCHCWTVQMLTFSTVCNGNEHRPHLR